MQCVGRVVDNYTLNFKLSTSKQFPNCSVVDNFIFDSFFWCVGIGSLDVDHYRIWSYLRY